MAMRQRRQGTQGWVRPALKCKRKKVVVMQRAKRPSLPSCTVLALPPPSPSRLVQDSQQKVQIAQLP